MKNYIQKYKIAPIGHILKHQFSDICFRIHNLDKKQYPENLDDKNEIIERYIRCFNIIFNNTDITGYLSTYDTELNELENSWVNELKLKDSVEFNIAEEGEEAYYVTTYEFSFDKKILKEIILDVANELFDGSILFYSKNNNNIIAPYPGGADIFIPDKNLYEKAQKSLSSWVKA